MSPKKCWTRGYQRPTRRNCSSKKQQPYSSTSMITIMAQDAVRMRQHKKREME